MQLPKMFVTVGVAGLAAGLAWGAPATETCEEATPAMPQEMGLVMLQVKPSDMGHASRSHRKHPQPAQEKEHHHHDKDHHHEKEHRHHVSHMGVGTKSNADDAQTTSEADGSCRDGTFLGYYPKMGMCIKTKYGAQLGCAIAVTLALALWFYLLKKTNKDLKAKNRGLRAKLQVDRARISADMKKLRAARWAIREDKRLLMQAIHDRGNVFFDADLGEIVLKREIPINPRPPARYSDIRKAQVVLADVVEILNLLPGACVLIEGHTMGGLTELPDAYAHEVAEGRALLVKDSLVMLGGSSYSLVALGLPGVLGNNKNDVLIKLADV